MALTKSLQKRIDLANKYIKFAQKHDIFGRGHFGSTMEEVFTYPHLITVSPTGRSVRVRYHDAYGRGKHSQSFNTNDPDSVSDLRYEITHYVIGAIKRGAKDDHYSIPKTLSNPTKRNTAYRPGIDGPALSISRGFDRYERMPYWTVSRGRGETATFQSWIYGTKLAEDLANKFYRSVKRGTAWRKAYKAIPVPDKYGAIYDTDGFRIDKWEGGEVLDNPRKRKTYEWTDDGKPGRYKIYEGFDHRRGKPLYQVVGVNNDYVGEWHTSKASAQRELKATLEEDRYDNPRKRKNSRISMSKLKKGDIVYGKLNSGMPVILKYDGHVDKFGDRYKVGGARWHTGIQQWSSGSWVWSDTITKIEKGRVPSKRRNPTKRNKALTRRQKENAIAGKFPPDSKRGRGDNRVIMVTGSVAEILGVPDYTRFTMASGMTDEQIDTLYDFLVLRKRSNPRKRLSNPRRRKNATSIGSREMVRPMGVGRKQWDDQVGVTGWSDRGQPKGIYLYELDTYSHKFYRGVPLKRGEKLFRFVSDSTNYVEPHSRYLVKINVDRDLIYFMTEDQGSNERQPSFETRGVKATYLKLKQ